MLKNAMNGDFDRAAEGPGCLLSRQTARRLRKLQKLEETFELWIRTGSPVDAPTIRDTLVNHLGFEHRVPHGGSSHITLTHPNGQSVTVVVSSKKRHVLDYQVEAARAGLAVIEIERAALSPPKAPEPPPAPKSQKTPAPALQTRITGDYDLLPIEGFEKTWVLRSRDYPQAGAVLYDGASDTDIAAAKTAIERAAEDIRLVLSQSDLLEFDILKDGDNLLLTHRVHQGLNCTLPPFDPFAKEGNADTRQSLGTFTDIIQQMDEENETALGNIVRAFRLQEGQSISAPDGSRGAHCTYIHIITDEPHRAQYRRSPQGRVDPTSLLDLVDSIYTDVFETLKKDARKLYGLESTQAEKGIVRIRHPYFWSIDVQIPDLRRASLKAAYEKATGTSGFAMDSKGVFPLLQRKIDGLGIVLEARNKTENLIDAISREYNRLIASAAAFGHIKMRTVSSRKPGESGFLEISSSMERDLKCQMEFLARTPTSSEKAQAQIVPIIPKPEGLVALYHFLVECGSDQLPAPPFPFQSAVIAAENAGQTFPPANSRRILLVPICAFPQGAGHYTPPVSSPA